MKPAPIPTIDRALAYLHFTIGSLNVAVGAFDIIGGRVSVITILNLGFAAHNVWLGFKRLEGK